ncbi:hypothetical protein JCM31598_43690 [Desulfonatronum parangueonense]
MKAKSASVSDQDEAATVTASDSVQAWSLKGLNVWRSTRHKPVKGKCGLPERPLREKPPRFCSLQTGKGETKKKPVLVDQEGYIGESQMGGKIIWT